MTLERILLVGNIAAIAFLVWLPWYLTRRPKPRRRGGFVGDRWKR
jgi:hypothetical protein